MFTASFSALTDTDFSLIMAFGDSKKQILKYSLPNLILIRITLEVALEYVLQPLFNKTILQILNSNSLYSEHLSFVFYFLHCIPTRGVFRLYRDLQSLISPFPPNLAVLSLAFYLSWVIT